MSEILTTPDPERLRDLLLSCGSQDVPAVARLLRAALKPTGLTLPIATDWEWGRWPGEAGARVVGFRNDGRVDCHGLVALACRILGRHPEAVALARDALTETVSGWGSGFVAIEAAATLRHLAPEAYSRVVPQLRLPAEFIEPARHRGSPRTAPPPRSRPTLEVRLPLDPEVAALANNLLAMHPYDRSRTLVPTALSPLPHTAFAWAGCLWISDGERMERFRLPDGEHLGSMPVPLPDLSLRLRLADDGLVWVRNLEHDPQFGWRLQVFLLASSGEWLEPYCEHPLYGSEFEVPVFATEVAGTYRLAGWARYSRGRYDQHIYTHNLIALREGSIEKGYLDGVPRGTNSAVPDYGRELPRMVPMTSSPPYRDLPCGKSCDWAVDDGCLVATARNWDPPPLEFAGDRAHEALGEGRMLDGEAVSIDYFTTGFVTARWWRLSA